MTNQVLIATALKMTENHDITGQQRSPISCGRMAGGLQSQGLHVSPERDRVMAYFSVNATDRSRLHQF